MRKIILNLAISLDGYIADENGGFEWIMGHGDDSLDTEQQFDFPMFLESIDTIVMGSKAFEDTPNESIQSFSDKKLLIASSRKFDIPVNAEIINGDLSSKILKLREKDGKDIWLFGGGVTIDEFIKADIIDEYIIGIIPIILGKGKRLFLENNPTIKLKLQSSSVIDGISMLTYSKR